MQIVIDLMGDDEEQDDAAPEPTDADVADADRKAQEEWLRYSQLLPVPQLVPVED